MTPPQGLRVSGLRASYRGRQVLRGLDLQVAPGEFVVLLGANGSGKSTALRCIAGLHSPDGGRVDGLGHRPAMVFQRPSLVGRRTVLDNVCAGALGRLSLRRSLVFPDDERWQAMTRLHRVGLAERATDRARRLSGGQQQRVAIARALQQVAGQPEPVLLADEPVSALDPTASEHVLALLADLAHGERLPVLAVLHQPDLARRYADRVIGLRDGVAAFAGSPSEVTFDMIDALYAENAA